MQDRPAKAIRIVLADDHPIVRAGIRETLKQVPGVEVVGEANDGREAIEVVKSVRPDLVLLDISMPGLNGLEATERIVKAYPETRVIILSRHENEEYYWHALKIGACGYLLKNAVVSEIKAAVQRVAGGDIYLSQQISRRLRDRLPTQQLAHARNPVENLSPRQREILQLIAEGETTKGIALVLKLSPKTVEYHRMQLMQRLNIFDIPGLVRLAVRTGLVSQEG
jgi:DNA-binding NarL/FixJ family response regulator